MNRKDANLASGSQARMQATVYDCISCFRQLRTDFTGNRCFSTAVLPQPNLVKRWWNLVMGSSASSVCSLTVRSFPLWGFAVSNCSEYLFSTTVLSPSMPETTQPIALRFAVIQEAGLERYFRARPLAAKVATLKWPSTSQRGSWQRNLVSHGELQLPVPDLPVVSKPSSATHLDIPQRGSRGKAISLPRALSNVPVCSLAIPQLCVTTLHRFYSQCVLMSAS